MQYPSWSSENTRIMWLQSAEHYGNLPFIQPLRSQNVTIRLSIIVTAGRTQYNKWNASEKSVYHWLHSCTISLAGKLIVRTKKPIRRENYFGPLTSKSVAVSISIFSTARSWFISVTDCIASASAWQPEQLQIMQLSLHIPATLQLWSSPNVNIMERHWRKCNLCRTGARNLHASINFSSQGQMSRSNMFIYMRLIELTKTHYHVKLHKSLASSFRVIGSCHIQKYETNSHVKGQGKGQISPKLITSTVHHNTYSYQVTSVHIKTMSRLTPVLNWLQHHYF